MQIRFAVALLGMLAACAPAAEAGGSYMAVGPDRAEFIQIVESPDRSLSGSAIFVMVTDAGKIETKQYALTGAKEGKSLQIVLKRGAWGLGDAVLVGEERGDRLKLIVGSSADGLVSGTYTPATTTDFERANAQLSVVAANRASRKAEADAIRNAEQSVEGHARRLDALAREIRSFVQDHADATSLLARGKVAYASLEKQMGTLIASVTYSSDPVDQRNAQLDLRNALMDVEYRANAIDRELGTRISDHVNFANVIQDKLADFNSGCEYDRKSVPSGVQRATTDRWISSCRSLAAAIAEAHESFSMSVELAEEFHTELIRSQQKREALMRR